MIAPITQRKIGALEVLLFIIVLEAVRGNALAVLGFLIVATCVFLGRVHFGGDFSLSQLHGLVTAKKPTTKE